jgi:hypothetical protein
MRLSPRVAGFRSEYPTGFKLECMAGFVGTRIESIQPPKPSQADAYEGYGKLYDGGRAPGPILEAACSVHTRRPFFAMADLAENARRKAQGKKPVAISPLALEAVRRIDELFEIERAINGQSPERRNAVRQELIAPLVANLEAWMREQRAELSRGNDVAKARTTCSRVGPRVHTLPRRWPHLPVQQCRRARRAWHRFVPKLRMTS